MRTKPIPRFRKIFLERAGVVLLGPVEFGNAEAGTDERLPKLPRMLDEVSALTTIWRESILASSESGATKATSWASCISSTKKRSFSVLKEISWSAELEMGGFIGDVLLPV